MVKANRESHLLLLTFYASRHLARSICISSIVLFSCAVLFAQIDDSPMPDDVAPPPLKTISKDEKDVLASESGVKNRTITFINLLEARLRKAEESSAQEDFGGSLAQFGVYQGLLENMIGFLTAENKSDKALGGFKRLELTLRAHNIRIENVRRAMPFKYAYHVLRLQKFIRKSRAQATESLFSDSVIPDKKL